MKILFDHQIFSIQPFGGISRYFTRVFESFNDNPKIKIDIGGVFYINNYINLRGMVKVKPKFRIIIYLINYIYMNIKILIGKYQIIHNTYYYPNLISPQKSINILTVYDMIHEIFNDKTEKTTTLM